MVGAGGHAEACIEIVETEGVFSITGIVGLAEEKGRTVLGYPVVGCDEDLAELLPTCRNVLVGIGQIRSPLPRKKAFEKICALGGNLPTIIAPTARISRHAKIGEGTIVMHGVTVQAGATVGRNCIVNDHALVEHGTKIGDHCHISTGAILNGGVRIEEGCFVGSGAIIQENVHILSGTIVPMGANVKKDRTN